MCEVVERALAREPADRWASAADLAAAGFDARLAEVEELLAAIESVRARRDEIVAASGRAGRARDLADRLNPPTAPVTPAEVVAAADDELMTRMERVWEIIKRLDRRWRRMAGMSRLASDHGLSNANVAG